MNNFIPKNINTKYNVNINTFLSPTFKYLYILVWRYLFSVSFMFCLVWFCLPNFKLIFPSIYRHIYPTSASNSTSPNRISTSDQICSFFPQVPYLGVVTIILSNSLTRNVFNFCVLTSHIPLVTISIYFAFEIFLKFGSIAIVLIQAVILAFFVTDS